MSTPRPATVLHLVPVLLLAACGTADSVLPRPIVAVAVPAAVATPQGHDYAGLTARDLAVSPPRVFVKDAPLLRNDAEYLAILTASGTDGMARGGIDLVAFGSLLQRLHAIATTITAVPVRDHISTILRGGIDGLAASPDLSVFEAAKTHGIVMDDWKLVPAQDAPADMEIEGFCQRRGVPGSQLAVPLRGKTGGTQPDGTSTQERWYAWLSEDDAWRVVVIADLLHQTLEQNAGFGAIATRLRHNQRRWDNYLAHGYPQYPWENLANDWLVGSSWDRAPTRQFLLLHAEPGILVDMRGAKRAAVDPALLIHGIGHLWYRGGDNSWFVGASATAALSGDEGTGLGYGITLHAGRSTAASVLPQLSIGLLWHDGRDGDGFLLSASIDVLGLFQSAK